MKRILKGLSMFAFVATLMLSLTSVQAATEERLGNLTIDKFDYEEQVEFEIRQTYGYNEAGELVEIDDGVVIVEWTDGYGRLTLNDLPLGRYEVRELFDSSGEMVDSRTYSVKIPFLDENEQEYVYDVYLFTMHGPFNAVKTQSPSEEGRDEIEPITVASGNEIDYTIQIEIPEDIHDTILTKDGEEIPKYTQVTIMDELDSYLTFVEGSLTPSISHEPVSLILGTEYLFEFDGANQTLTVTLLQDGIEHLVPGEVLEIHFSALVDEAALNHSIIGNPSKISFITQNEAGEQVAHKTSTNKTIANVELVEETEAGYSTTLIVVGMIVVGAVGGALLMSKKNKD